MAWSVCLFVAEKKINKNLEIKFIRNVFEAASRKNGLGTKFGQWGATVYSQRLQDLTRENELSLQIFIKNDI